MQISFNTIFANFNLNIGYGTSAYGMIRSLQRLGHQAPFRNPECEVEIAFCQPHQTEWSRPDIYKIQYTPWESTALPKGWLEGFNSSDEVWTPSPLIAQWYKDAGVTTPIFVYEHGIDKTWSNVRRNSSGVLRFLHHGSPAPRKGAQMAVDAFREAFGDRTDVHLTIKAHDRTEARAMDGKGNILGTVEHFNNVSLVDDTIDEADLVKMYHEHDVLVYPGWGEGFGLIPLQAMATGMPTICTEAWAPYARLLLPELTLGSKLVDSPWEAMHPGKMFQPSYEDLVNAYRTADANFERLAGRAYRNGFKVHEEYDWDTLTEAAFKHIVEKFS